MEAAAGETRALRGAPGSRHWRDGTGWVDPGRKGVLVGVAGLSRPFRFRFGVQRKSGLVGSSR